MKQGMVYLVGAGPGDAGLLTVRACECLQRADVVLYDSLVGDAILSLVPETCRRIAVGKRAGNHLVPQEETNHILLREALAGNCVVRLKGGDPFLFGRGGEELELLAEHQVPFEIVPGVTSAIAVPAYNGIPVTHRDWASSLHIITAHRRAGKEESIDYESLVQMGGTLVFLMGVRQLSEICSGLIAAGMSGTMPAAVLERGTTAHQRRVVASLESLPEESARAEIGMPAIIVVGEVCALSEVFAWAEKRPLAGEKILLMRPRPLIRSFAERLREQGAEVLEVPLIDTVPVRMMDQTMQNLQQYQWIVLTSPTGVRLFFEALAGRKTDLRKLAECRFAVIGEGSRRELEARGFYADLMPEVYTGEALGAALRDAIRAELQEENASGQTAVSGQEVRILIPRAKRGNPELPALLSEFLVDDIPLYETVSLKPELLDLPALFAQGEITRAVFTSASMVRAFAEAVGAIDYSRVCAVCIGEQTAAAARGFGMAVHVSEQATVASLEEKILELHGTMPE